MNKTYKVIWSKVRNAYVVVSELAKSHGKDKACHSAPLSHGLACAVMLGCLVGGSAMVGGLPAAEAADTTTYVREGKTGDATVKVTQEALRQKNEFTLAVGETTEADGAFALAIGGSRTKADGPQAIAIGTYETEANGEDSLAIGGERTKANGNYAIAIGSISKALGDNAIAIGGGESGGGTAANAWSNYTIAIGHGSIAGTAEGSTSPTATSAIAIGKDAVSYGQDDVVIGMFSRAAEPDAEFTSLETDAGNTQHHVTGGRVVIGRNNTATGRATSSVVLGARNVSNSVRGIAIGQDASAGMPEGTKSGDGNDLIYEDTMAIGTHTRAYGENSIAIGKNSIAGNKDKTTSDKNGQGAIALGEGANSTSMYTTAIGGKSVANNVYAVSVGYDAEAKAEYALAMGYQAAAIKNNAIAQGYNASATAASAIAMGSDAHAYAGDGSIALGANSKVDFKSAAGSVALGANSTVTKEREVGTGWNGQDSTWSTRVVKKRGALGSTSSNIPIGGSAAWNSTDGVVSIGTDDKNNITSYTRTRQLTGLAAGVYDTDAVNMAQWKNTMLATAGDVKSDTLQTNYGTTKAPSTATRLLDESLTITGAGDTARTDGKKALEKSDLTSEANIGTIVSDNQIDIRLAKKLEGLESASFKSATGNSTKVSGDGITITPASGNKVSLTQTGLSNGGNKITNVGKGEISDTSTDAVNGSQLNEVKKLAAQNAKPVKITAEGKAPTNATYVGKNLQVNVTTDGDGQTTYDLKLGDNLSIGGKDGADGKNGTNGHIGVNGADGKSGVGIDGADGISIKGKDGKDGVTIKGVDGVDGVNGAEGHIGLNGKDGMTDIWTKPGNPGLNGKDGETMTRIVYKDPQGQEHQAATLDDGLKFGGDFGTASAVKLNKQVNVKGNAKKEADLTDGNIGVVSSQYGDNGQLLIKLNKDLNLTDKGSVKMGNTTISNSGITINNGTKTVSLTDGGLNNGGNKITNVGKGEISDTSTDAVNGSQLKSVQDLAGQHSSVEAGPSGNITVISGTNDAGGKKYTVDLANNVNFGQGDKQISINGDNGTVTIGQGDKQIQLNSKDGSITAGDVTINNDGKGTVNGLTNKSWDGEHITSGQAATEDQLQKVEQNVNTKIDTVAKQHTTVSVNGGNAAGNLVMEKTPETDEKGANYDISLSNDVTIGTQGEKGKDGKLTVVSKDGMKAITADAQNGTLTFKDGNNETSIKAAEASKGVDGTTDIKRVAIDGHTMATTDDGMKFAGDSGGTLQQKLNSTTNIKGGADASKLSDSNIGVVSDGKDTLTVKLAKDIKGLDSIETKTVKAETVNSNTFNAGNTTINNDGLTVKTSDSSRTITVQDGNVNMGKNVVTGVADGKIAPGSTDAVNGSQLAQRDEAINNIGGEVNKLGNRVNRVGAGAAALAALHPQDFDPDDKWDFAVGYGNYRGSNAAALGAFYRPNEDTTFSVGGTIGGGENMVNAGVSFKIGQGNHVSNSRVAMAKEIKSLREDVAQLEGIVNRQSAMINKLTGTNPGTVQSQDSELFPDIPANHWAYEYVNKLKQLGVVKGYPDGNFDGDRMMTRYEFATMLYRAIMAGAASNPELNKDGTLDRLAKEFSPELKYIRIDTIAHDKDGNPTIQRVRVIPGVK